MIFHLPTVQNAPFPWTHLPPSPAILIFCEYNLDINSQVTTLISAIPEANLQLGNK